MRHDVLARIPAIRQQRTLPSGFIEKANQPYELHLIWHLSPPQFPNTCTAAQSEAGESGFRIHSNCTSRNACAGGMPCASRLCTAGEKRADCWVSTGQSVAMTGGGAGGGEGGAGPCVASPRGGLPAG